MVTFVDDFSRTSLGPEWTEAHLDGLGSVTLDGTSCTIVASSGDFWKVHETGGSLIYRPIGYVLTSPMTALAKIETTNIADWTRVFVMMGAEDSNEAFFALARSGSSGNIVPMWRDTAGASPSVDETNGAPYNSAEPLWVKIEYDGSAVTCYARADSDASYTLINTITITDPLTIVGPAATYHMDPSGLVFGYYEQQNVGWLLSGPAGAIKDASGNAAQRTIRVYRRSNGTKFGETVSAADGSWSLETIYDEPHDVVVLDDDAGTQYRDIIIPRVTPAQQ